MQRDATPYIPQDVSEIVDHLALMMLYAPTFEDEVFPDRTVESTFFQLEEALRLAQRELGEGRYAALHDLAVSMRSHFESDPHETNGRTMEGRRLIRKMQVLLIGREL